MKLAAKEYVWIVFFAFMLGVPLGSYLIRETITDLLTFSKPFSIMPVLAAFGMTLLAIVSQSWAKYCPPAGSILRMY